MTPTELTAALKELLPDDTSGPAPIPHPGWSNPIKREGEGENLTGLHLDASDCVVEEWT